MESLLTFSMLQERLSSTEIRAVFESLNDAARENPAARLIQSALELSESVLSEDTSQLAAQLIGRLTVHRDSPAIAAFLDTIIPPAGTLQAVNTGYSTHIAARMSELPQEASLLRPSINELPHLLPEIWFRLPDGDEIKRHRKGLNFRSGKYIFEKPLKQTHGAFREDFKLSNTHFISTFEQGAMLLWDTHTHEALWLIGHTAAVRGVVMMADGQLLSWSGDHTLRLWEPSGRPLRVLSGHTKGIWGVLQLSDGGFVSWSKDTTLRRWSADGEPLAVMIGHTKTILGVRVLSDGRFISWSKDNTLRLWSPNGEALTVMVGHTGWPSNVLELPDGRFLSWSIGEIILRVWSPNGQLDGIFEGHQEAIHFVASHSKGKLISYAHLKALAWKLDMLSPLPKSAHPAIVWGITALTDGRFISWSFDREITLWSRDGQKLRTLTGHILQVRGAAIVDEQILSWSGRYSRQDLRLWDADGNAIRTFERADDLNTDALKTAIRAKNSRFTLSTGNYVIWHSYPFAGVNELVLYDPAGAMLKILIGRSNLPTGLRRDQILDLIGYVEDVNFLNDCLIVWSRMGGYIFDSHGDVIARFPKEDTSRVRLALLSEELFVIHPQRSHAAVRIYASDGTLVKALEAHRAGDIYAAIIKNRCIITWADDGVVKVWDAHTFEQTHAFYMDYPVTACAVLSESPLRLAIGDKSGRIAVVSA